MALISLCTGLPIKRRMAYSVTLALPSELVASHTVHSALTTMAQDEELDCLAVYHAHYDEYQRADPDAEVGMEDYYYYYYYYYYSERRGTAGTNYACMSYIA